MITRIVSCFALPQSYPTFAYREAYAPLLCSFWGVSQGHSPTIVQAQVGSRPFDTVILYHKIIVWQQHFRHIFCCRYYICNIDKYRAKENTSQRKNRYQRHKKFFTFYKKCQNCSKYYYRKIIYQHFKTSNGNAPVPVISIAITADTENKITGTDI